MNEIIKVCKVHGELIKSQCTIEKIGTIRCKLCRIITRLKKSSICKYHGNLTPDQIHKDGNCALCKREKSNAYKKNNRGLINSRTAIDKIKNPEKWEKIYKDEYKRRQQKYGKLLSLHKQCLARGITVEQYNEMLDKQNNKCKICEQEEKRIDGVTKQIGRLTIDHCHTTNKVRGLLCHNCNVALGNFRDDTIRMYRAIRYIKQGGL